jgi:hypothetical protein
LHPGVLALHLVSEPLRFAHLAIDVTLQLLDGSAFAAGSSLLRRPLLARLAWLSLLACWPASLLACSSSSVVNASASKPTGNRHENWPSTRSCI